MSATYVVASNGKFHSFSLAAALERRGVLVRFYTPYYSQQNTIVARWAGRRDAENLLRVRTNIWTELPHRVGTRMPWIRPYADYIKAAWFDHWVAWHLRAESADVFLGWSNSSVTSLKTAKVKAMQTVITRGSAHISQQKELLGREYAKRGMQYLPPYGIEVRELAEYELADHIRVPSSYVCRTFLERGVPGSKLLLNPHSVDLRYFRPRPGPGRAVFRVLFLNATTVRKGYYYAAEAVRALNRARGSRIEFWFVGQAEKEIKRDLRRLLSEHDNVRLLGFVPYQELAKCITQCDLGVFPTVEEGLASVVMQTMACGVPVIATVNSGAEDVLQDGQEGFIVPGMDADTLLSRCLWCYEHRAACREIGARAANRIAAWTWDDVVNQLVERLEGSEASGRR